MTERRKSLLILLPLFVAFLFLGGIGVAELVLWFALLAAWLVAFVVWGRSRSES